MALLHHGGNMWQRQLPPLHVIWEARTETGRGQIGRGQLVQRWTKVQVSEMGSPVRVPAGAAVVWTSLQAVFQVLCYPQCVSEPWSNGKEESGSELCHVDSISQGLGAGAAACSSQPALWFWTLLKTTGNGGIADGRRWSSRKA